MSTDRVREPRINSAIRAPEVRVVDASGRNVGVMTISKALILAREQGLDLVEVQPTAVPPVCRVMDYGKYKYEIKKKSRHGKKTRPAGQEKLIRLRMNTAPNDILRKIRHARELLQQGNRVTFSMRLRGRELDHIEEARAPLERCRQELADVAKVEKDVGMEGNTLLFSLAPAPVRGRRPQGEPKGGS